MLQKCVKTTKRFLIPRNVSGLQHTVYIALDLVVSRMFVLLFMGCNFYCWNCCCEHQFDCRQSMHHSLNFPCLYFTYFTCQDLERIKRKSVLCCIH